jgi:hypothetical protein
VLVDMCAWTKKLILSLRTGSVRRNIEFAFCFNVFHRIWREKQRIRSLSSRNASKLWYVLY